MDDDEKTPLKVVDKDFLPTDSPDVLVPPTGGRKFSIYSLRERVLHRPDFLPNWQSFWGTGKKGERLANNPRRSERQAGKILEAQAFRKMQGVYLEARLQLFKAAKQREFGLRWWFGDHKRICLHHLIMRNYYIEDRPTSEEEILLEQWGSDKSMRLILKMGVEIGSLECDPLEEDGRKNVYYPTRGMVSDTDRLFKSEEKNVLGTFVYFRQAVLHVFGGQLYTLNDYFRDSAEFDDLVEDVMSTEDSGKKYR